MPITGPHLLPPDLVILSVRDLDPDVRARIACDDDAFTVSRPRARTPPKVIDARTAELLRGFSTARPIVDVILDFSRTHRVEAEPLLAEAFPILQRFVDAGLLVEEGSDRARQITATHDSGDRIGDWEVLRCIQVLEDAELYQVRGSGNDTAALKVARQSEGAIRAMLRRESRALARLDGSTSPRLMGSGTHEGRDFLTMEWRSGVDVGQFANELRTSGTTADRHRLVTLCADIASAYANVHARGVLHGDVHERNLLVDAHAAVTILDFGLARFLDDDADADDLPRGGIGIYFEPEYAIARREKASQPPVTPAAEQYSVAAMLYSLFTGTTYLDFRSDRDQAMRQIAEEAMLPFSSRGLAPFPELELLLGRALSKSPEARFASLSDMALALRAVAQASALVDESAGQTIERSPTSLQFQEQTLDMLRLDGSLFESGIPDAPRANVNFGAAGVACALYRVALARGEPALLSLADVWATRALRTATSRGAFYNARLGLTRSTVGTASLYHTASGIHVVRGLIARAMGDFVTMEDAIETFVAVSQNGGRNLDLALGRSGILLGCALLLEAIPRGMKLNVARLTRFGDSTARVIWQRLDLAPTIAQPSEFASLGIAHGWAGMLYSTARWRLARGQPLGASFARRLRELAASAEPEGRGVRWRWIDNGRGERPPHGYMSGWCNGSAGFVYLWLLAADACRDGAWLDLALGAAWNAWEDDSDETTDLCCGLAGRSYALLAVYRATGNAEWLARALALAERIVDVEETSMTPDIASLYKSNLGAALLFADLAHPETARMPLFEAEGWPAR
jgi:serine/threonine-protein kinase